MSINKDRKFRFTYNNFVDTVVDPNDNSRDKTVTIPMGDVTFHNVEDKEYRAPIQMSDAERNRLSAMARQAKENGGNSSMNNSYAEYLAKIPAKQDNYINMMIAGDKLKELKTKMNEEIEKTSPDEMTNDVLTTAADDNIIYKNYDMSDLDKYMEKINTMSMLEAVSLKNSVTKELNRLESCHTMVKTVANLRDNFDVVSPGKEPSAIDHKNAGTNVNKDIMTANYLDDYGYQESADEFNKLYDVYQPKLTALIETLNKHIDECSKQAASTKYMTNDFLHIINKKINNMKSTDMNYDYNMKKLQMLKTAFENRTDLTYLKNKLEVFSKNKTHLKNLAKAMNGTFSDITSKLNGNFAKKTMSAFIKEIDDNFVGDMYYNITFLYFLNYVCTSEAKTYADAWVKIFVLNASDIHNDIWDLDIPAEKYMANTVKEFYPMMDAIYLYLKQRKVKISSQILTQYNALLNWVPEVEETSESKEEIKVKPEEDDVEHVEAEVVDLHDTHGSFNLNRNEVIDVTPEE